MSDTSLTSTAAIRRAPNLFDLAALLVIAAGLMAIGNAARHTLVPVAVANAVRIDLDPVYLPGYALRTTLRMFAALGVSLLFAFTYATWAAKSRRARLVLVPVLDILQSLPIFGFLTFTLSFFMGLFPGQVVGEELAVVFTIFTSQAWNMAFSMYQSLTTVPADLEEAARGFRLTAWQRFWRLDVPFAMPGLIWNMMMSMSGGWFALVASEAISVGNVNFTLPGIGSYIKAALDARDIHAVFYAIVAMLLVILAYDQLLFRPLVAWSAKFRLETTQTEQGQDPWVLGLLRRTRLLRLGADAAGTAFFAFSGMRLWRVRVQAVRAEARPRRVVDAAWLAILGLVVVLALYRIVTFCRAGNLGLGDVERAVTMGLYTLVRVAVLMVIATIVWVPIGVTIGLRPVLAKRVGGRRAIPGGVPGQSAVSDLCGFHHPLFAQSRYLADAADHPGRAVVSAVQRRGRRERLPRRSARGGAQFPRGRASVVAPRHPAGDIPLFHHGRDHRDRRRVERRGAGGGGELGADDAEGPWAWGVYPGRDDGGGLGPGAAGDDGDGGVCARVQSADLAAAVCVFFPAASVVGKAFFFEKKKQKTFDRWRAR